MTTENLKRIKIEKEGQDVFIDCPYCNNWETMGIDEQRKNFHTFPIIKWCGNTLNGNELSLHRCTECNKEFEVEWDYNNSLNF